MLEEGRKLSDEAKYRIRRKRLVRRITRKYPLFADQFIRDALLLKPEYYGLTPEQARTWTVAMLTSDHTATAERGAS